MVKIMIKIFIKFKIIWIIWIKKLFLNKLVFVGKYVILVILLLLMLVEKVWLLVLYEIVKFDVVIFKEKVVLWVVLFLVKFV